MAVLQHKILKYVLIQGLLTYERCIMTISQYSDLKIIFSNCLIGGNSWNPEQIDLLDVIRHSLYDTDGIEFRAINTNNTSGEHTSTTITITGTFYNFNNNVNKTDMLDMEQIMTLIAQKIPNFTCSEVRIEHSRHRSIFDGVHPRLAQTI